MMVRDAGFALPNREPLTEQEWRWIEVLRSIAGGHLLPPTFQMTQGLQKMLKNEEG